MIARLTGRLTDGAERGAGRLLHVVPGDGVWGRALCGRFHHRLVEQMLKHILSTDVDDKGDFRLRVP